MKKYPIEAFKKLCPTSAREPIERALGRRLYHQKFDELECIFIHIPKTAGTSIGTALFSDGNTGHWKAKAYQWTNPKKFDEYFKFTVVRNPWDRLASAYFYLSQGGKNKSDSAWAERNLKKIKSFDHFVTTWLNDESIHSWGHFVPQINFIKQGDGSINIDLIARFENLTEDFIKIQKKLSSNNKLTTSNCSSRPNYKTLYTEKTKNIIYNLYKEDIETFNYEF